MPDIAGSIYKGAMAGRAMAENRSIYASMADQKKDQEAMSLYQEIASQAEDPNDLDSNLMKFEAEMNKRGDSLRGKRVAGAIYNQFENDPRTQKMKGEFSNAAIIAITSSDSDFKKLKSHFYESGMKRGFGQLFKKMGINSQEDVDKMDRWELASKILDPKAVQGIANHRMRLLEEVNRPSGGRGAGAKEIQFAKALVAAKFQDPDTGSPITYDRALVLAPSMLKSKDADTESGLTKQLALKGMPVSKAREAAKQILGTQAPADTNSDWEEVK